MQRWTILQSKTSRILGTGISGAAAVLSPCSRAALCRRVPSPQLRISLPQMS